MASVDIQIASKKKPLPSKSAITHWIECALPTDKIERNISCRIVDAPEIQALNRRYRHKDQTTNVLSFPCELPEDVIDPLLGDIIICAEVVAEEARDFGKSLEAHWAHMLVHGTLHLLGYDHVGCQDAEIMENMETKILTALGFPEPYAQQDCGE